MATIKLWQIRAAIAEGVTRLNANESTIRRSRQSIAIANADLIAIPSDLKPQFEAIAGLPDGPSKAQIQEELELLFAAAASKSERCNKLAESMDGVPDEE